MWHLSPRPLLHTVSRYLLEAGHPLGSEWRHAVPCAGLLGPRSAGAPSPHAAGLVQNPHVPSVWPECALDLGSPSRPRGQSCPPCWVIPEPARVTPAPYQDPPVPLVLFTSRACRCCDLTEGKVLPRSALLRHGLHDSSHGCQPPWDGAGAPRVCSEPC